MRIDLPVSKKTLLHWLDYVRGLGWSVEEKKIHGEVYYKSDLDWNYGVIASRLDCGQCYIHVRLPQK